MSTGSLVYIVMPFRPGKHSQRENIARANEVGRFYASQGYHVVVPHNLSPECDPFNRFGDAYWLATTLDVMERCDIVVCGPGWQDSEGCRTERERAEELGLDVLEMGEVEL